MLWSYYQSRCEMLQKFLAEMEKNEAFTKQAAEMLANVAFDDDFFTGPLLTAY